MVIVGEELKSSQMSNTDPVVMLRSQLLIIIESCCLTTYASKNTITITSNCFNDRLMADLLLAVSACLLDFVVVVVVAGLEAC